jgi:PAS domain S-box-containing protein
MEQENSSDELRGDGGSEQELIKQSADWRSKLFEYSQIVENANETIIIAQDDRLKFFNPKAVEVTGYALDELASRPFIEFIHPDDRDMVAHNYRRRLAGEPAPRVYSFRIIDKAGQVIWVETVAVPINWEGKPAVLNFLSDITERKRAAQAFRESEDRFRCLSEATSEGIGVTERGKIIDVNEQLARMFGYEPAELIGRPVMDLIAPESRDLVHHMSQAKSEVSYEHLALRKDGSIFPVEIRRKSLSYPGRIVKVTSIRDISERKQTEEKIRRRNRELTLLNRVIAASTTNLEPPAILETVCRELALAFDVAQVTAALFDKTRLTAQIIAEYLAEGRPSVLNEFIPLEDNSIARYLFDYKAPLVATHALSDPRLASIQELLRRRATVSLLLVPLMVEGEVIGVLALEAAQLRAYSSEELNLARSVAGQVAGVLARLRLDAERQRLEEQYHQAQKMEALGRLTAGIAHDFNNMLTAINGFTALLESELPADDPRQDMVSRILHSGRRAADLVRQLLAFSRQQVIEPRVLDLNEVVLDLNKMLHRVIGEDIQLQTELAPDLWPVKVDATQMEQVIINIAVNARDAMPEGGHLIIETANVVIDENYVAGHLGMQPGDYILLAISDTGCGMSPDIKAHIFEPFFTTKPIGKGTGLGLATVFGIIKQNGGDIWVYSEEGLGTTFKIYLPSARELKPAPVNPALAEDMLSGSETVLLVEDDLAVRQVIRWALTQKGYTLLEAQDGAAALNLVANQPGPIHLLLTDVIMPAMSGKELARQVVQIRPDIKVLFMSGYTNESIAHHGVLDPNIAFLQKPFTPISLARKVRAVLDS